MDNREAFEKWYADNGPIPKQVRTQEKLFERHIIDSDKYLYDQVRIAWNVWQAATAHNTDAVIDKCRSICLDIGELEISKGNHRESSGALSCSKALRSLKTNKEG